MIDTHCHIDEEDEYDEILKDDFNNGVLIKIVSFCDVVNYDFALFLASKYNGIYLTLGFHPEYADFINYENLLYLENTIVNNKKIIGIGEIGLDYHYDNSNKNKQIELFKKQIELSIKLDLPIVVHSRDSVLDTINILSQYKNIRGVIHCFNDSLEDALKYIDMGFYLGIGGIITFKNSNLFNIIKNIGLSNVVLETDSPYLAPVPVRGKKNSSKNIIFIASKIAEILDISVDDVLDKTSKNAKRVFDL